MTLWAVNYWLAPKSMGVSSVSIHDVFEHAKADASHEQKRPTVHRCQNPSVMPLQTVNAQMNQSRLTELFK
jgi:hypothetical protein